MSPLPNISGDTLEKPKRTQAFSAELVEKRHQALPINIREYLHKRGLTDAVIDAHKLGYGQFYRKPWITIPIKDVYGNHAFFQSYDRTPALGTTKSFLPKRSRSTALHEWDMLSNIDTDKQLVISEGEMDRLLLLSKGVPAITSTHGAMTFKEGGLRNLEKGGKSTSVLIMMMQEEKGPNGWRKCWKMLDMRPTSSHSPKKLVSTATSRTTSVKLNGSTEDLFQKYAKEYPERIDEAIFSDDVRATC